MSIKAIKFERLFNKIVVCYFQGIVNVMIHVLREHK